MSSLTVLFLYCLFVSSTIEYFFTDEIAKIELNCMKDVLKKIHEPMNSLVIDQKLPCKTNSIFYIWILPDEKKFWIYHYLKKGKKIKRKKIENDKEMLDTHKHDNDFFKCLCKRLRELFKNSEHEIYYSVDLSPKQYDKYYKDINDYILEFSEGLKREFPEIRVIENVAQHVDTYFYVKKTSKDDIAPCDIIYKRVGELDFYSYFLDDFHLPYMYDNFKRSLESFENEQIRRLYKKYRSLVSFKEENSMEIYSDTKICETTFTIKELEDRFFYLYIFELLKKNNQYTEDFILKHTEFFDILLNFIFNKKGFHDNLFILLNEYEEKDQKEHMNFFMYFNKTKTLYGQIDDIKNVEKKVDKKIQLLNNHKCDPKIIEYASKFFDMLLKDFDLTAKISLSKNLVDASESENLKEKLVFTCNSRLKLLIKSFIRIYNEIENIEIFPEYERSIFLQLNDVCKDQLQETMKEKVVLSPLIHYEIQSFVKFKD